MVAMPELAAQVVRLPKDQASKLMDVGRSVDHALPLVYMARMYHHSNMAHRVLSHVRRMRWVRGIDTTVAVRWVQSVHHTVGRSDVALAFGVASSLPQAEGGAVGIVSPAIHSRAGCSRPQERRCVVVHVERKYSCCSV